MTSPNSKISIETAKRVFPNFTGQQLEVRQRNCKKEKYFVNE